MFSSCGRLGKPFRQCTIEVLRKFYNNFPKSRWPAPGDLRKSRRPAIIAGESLGKTGTVRKHGKVGTDRMPGRGELAFIDWLRARTPADPRVLLGPGDDTAALRPSPG